MRIPAKYLFLFTLAFVNTSLAGLILYIGPVLSYVGSVDQIPLIIEGLLTGAIFSSMAGFFLSFVSKVQKKQIFSRNSHLILLLIRIPAIAEMNMDNAELAIINWSVTYQGTYD